MSEGERLHNSCSQIVIKVKYLSAKVRKVEVNYLEAS